jgi:putative flippase GtrA
MKIIINICKFLLLGLAMYMSRMLFDFLYFYNGKFNATIIAIIVSTIFAYVSTEILDRLVERYYKK